MGGWPSSPCEIKGTALVITREITIRFGLSQTEGDHEQEQQRRSEFFLEVHWLVSRESCRTSELTGRGVYIQPSIQSIKLRNTPPALRSNDVLDAPLPLSTQAREQH